jgi:hypothetical protein
MRQRDTVALRAVRADVDSLPAVLTGSATRTWPPVDHLTPGRQARLVGKGRDAPGPWSDPPKGTGASGGRGREERRRARPVARKGRSRGQRAARAPPPAIAPSIPPPPAQASHHRLAVGRSTRGRRIRGGIHSFADCGRIFLPPPSRRACERGLPVQGERRVWGSSGATDSRRRRVSLASTPATASATQVVIPNANGLRCSVKAISNTLYHWM